VTAVGIAVATVFRFWAYRTFVFVGGEAAPDLVEAESLEPETAA
jgi:hypothetical protein